MVDFPKVPESVDHAADNLLSPPTEELGNTLGSLFYICFGWLNNCADKLRFKHKQNLELYKSSIAVKIEAIPKENLIEPDLQIVGPALEDSKFCIQHEELRELYATLIASAMDNRVSDFVYPSFASMIKQMSPKDALILSYLKDASNEYIFPCAQILLKKCNSISQKVLYPHLLAEQIDELNEDAISISLASLERFGLITIDFVKSVTDYNYDVFKDHPMYRHYESLNIPENTELAINKGCILFTSLGKSFVNACIPQ